MALTNNEEVLGEVDLAPIPASIQPVSVNWHFWPFCNYSCHFCFGPDPKSCPVLSERDALRVPALLKAVGTEKLTITGGEPTLCHYLPAVIRQAKVVGLTTSIVSNGTGITPAFLDHVAGSLDTIGLSIDSAREDVEVALGRGRGCHVATIRKAIALIHALGIPLKLNTVVTRLNWEENISTLIEDLNPKRWKVFQVLRVDGCNAGRVDDLLVTREQFTAFVARHASLHPVAEDEEFLTDSYLKIDPAGRFYQDIGNVRQYSASIFSVGVHTAIKQVGWNVVHFVHRGGIYEWSTLQKKLVEV